MTDINIDFDADEQVTDILVDVTGAESGSMTEADFTESGTGPYTYEGTYTASATSGDLTFTLNTAADAGGNDGASGETDTVTLGGVVDSFEDADIAEYAGGTSYFEANTNAPVQAGSYSLKSTGSNDNTRRNIVSTSGLDAYPSAGDTIRVYMQSTVTDASDVPRNCGFLFFAQDTSNGYYVQMDGSNGLVKLFEKDAGGFTELDSAPITWSGNTWYTWEISTTSGGGTISVDVIETSSGSVLGTASGSSSLYTSGGVGFGSTFGTLVADHIEII